MTLFQVSIQQVTELGKNLPAIPPEYLPPILAFSFIFFLLSIIKLNTKMKLIIAAVLVVALVADKFLPSIISVYLTAINSPINSVLANLIKTFGSTGTLIISGSFLLLGLVFCRLTGKSLFRKVVKKAGEPTHGMEEKLKHLENERDHLITELKHAKGDPVHELQIEKKINKINEKINVLKAKLGLPITA